MLSSYVRFVRGSYADFKVLEQKRDDTLYFIYNEDETTASLYLGERLVSNGAAAGGSEESTTKLLKDLEDVALNELADRDFLIYDVGSGSWKNITFDSLVVEIKDNFGVDFNSFATKSELQTLTQTVNDNKAAVDNTITSLQNLVNNKVDKVIYQVENEDGTFKEVEGTLLSPTDKAKLDKLVIESDGDIAVSGNVDVSQVQGLSDWITNNRNNVNGLYPEADQNKLAGIEEGAQKNYISSVSEDFQVIEGHLILNESISVLPEKVQNLDQIINGYTNDEGVVVEGLTSIIENKLDISKFESAVGNLDILLANDNTLLDRVISIEEVLSWQQL